MHETCTNPQQEREALLLVLYEQHSLDRELPAQRVMEEQRKPIMGLKIAYQNVGGSAENANVFLE